ncbi:MAG: hypothetical protein ACK559_17650, partial [bacterium]
AHLLREAVHPGGLLQDLHHPLILLGSRRGVLLGFLLGQDSLQVVHQLLARWASGGVRIRICAWMHSSRSYPVQDLLLTHPHHVVC